MRLMFVGDISLGEHYFSFGHGPRTIAQESDIFEGVKEVLKRGDVTYGNLEGPLSDFGLIENEPESMVFRGSSAVIRQLKAAGFTLLQVANNHIAQHGYECYRETVDELRKENIEVVGIKDQEPLIFSKDDVRIAFIAASDIEDIHHGKNANTYEKFEINAITSKIEAVRSKVDWVFVCLHWGEESRVMPTKEQNKLKELLYGAGANFIIGHHPHIFYGIEFDDSHLCAYSLGNFVFDLPWDERLTKTAILELDLRKNEYKAYVWPVVIGKMFKPELNGEAVEIKMKESWFEIYSHNSGFRFVQVKKLLWFVSSILSGNIVAKIRFISRKFKLLFNFKKL